VDFFKKALLMGLDNPASHLPHDWKHKFYVESAYKSASAVVARK
jgi:hypothetical protein